MEVLELAMRLIRDECMKQDNCKTCRLRDSYDGCMLKEVPCSWVLISDDELEKTERLFM